MNRFGKALTSLFFLSLMLVGGCGSSSSLLLAPPGGGTPSFPDIRRIEVTPTADVMPLGTRRQFLATAILTTGATVDVTSLATWTSTDEAVVGVSDTSPSKGSGSALAVGSAEIEATVGQVVGRETVTVSAAVLEAVEVSPVVPVLPVGVNQQFTAEGRFTDGTVEDLTDQVVWNSSAVDVATVDSAGLAVGGSAGQTTITATATNGTGLSGRGEMTVTAAALTRIQVLPSVPQVADGRELQFVALGLYSDGQEEDVTSLANWTSGDTGVATVSNTAGTVGRAQTLSQGQVTISAVLQGIEGQTPLTVSPAELEFIEIFPLRPVVSAGKTRQLTAVGVFSNHTTLDLTDTVTWSSSDPAIAKVGNGMGSVGLVTGLVAGSADITATDPSTGLEVSVPIEVTSAVLQSIVVTPENATTPKGLDQQFVATGVYSDSSTQDLSSSVTWDSSASGTAAISNAPGRRGLASTIAPGATTISATDPSSGVSGQSGFTVSDAALVSIALAPLEASVPKGARLQYAATGTYTDATTRDLTQEANWSSSNERVAVIENRMGLGSGEATGLTVGQASISAVDSATGIQGSTTLTVTSAVLVSIQVSPPDARVDALSIQRYRAEGVYSDGSTVNLTRQVTWRSSRPLVFYVSNFLSGFGLALIPGQATITATLPLSDLVGSTTVRVRL